MKSNEVNSKLIMNLHNDVHAQEKILQVGKIHNVPFIQVLIIKHFLVLYYLSRLYFAAIKRFSKYPRE